jgi:16S rRNA processing protein RimM
MAYKSELLLGRITKISGYEGSVAVKLEKIFTENIPEMESVFLEIEGKPVPFFITDLEYSGADILKLRFAGYDSIEKISEFTGCNVYLTTGSHPEEYTDDYQDLCGYEIFINDNQFVGTVKEVIPNPGQLLLSIRSPQNKEILIPFHEHFIVGIDKKVKVIYMDIPDGLTEIN